MAIRLDWYVTGFVSDNLLRRKAAQYRLLKLRKDKPIIYRFVIIKEAMLIGTRQESINTALHIMPFTMYVH